MGQIKVLVTGGAGFIGSHLADKLLQQGFAVTVVDDLSGGYKRNVDPKCNFILADLRDATETARIIKNLRPEVIYHLAANAAEAKAQFAPVDITTRNYNTFLNVLVAGLQSGSMKRIIVTSSIAVYGSADVPFKENSRPHPDDVYGLSKLNIEDTLKILSKVHKFEYVITRPHNVYGPRQNMQDPYRNVVTIFMNALLKGDSYNIYGDGNQQRCFSYIDDVVEALYKCSILDVNGKIFNIGSDKIYSVNQLSDTLQNIVGKNHQPNHLPSRTLDVAVAVPSHNLAKKYLHYEDKTSLEEGLSLTWKYAQSLGYQEPVYGGIELTSQHIPLNWLQK